MKNKYYNDALIGNENIVVSFNSKGELLRLYYPTRDYRQFVDELICGIRINKSMLIKLNSDSSNKYEQYYSKKTNVLNTKITNKEFGLTILQTNFVLMGKDVVICKYSIKNDNNIDLNLDFLIYSKLLSSFNNMMGSRIDDDILLQYSHTYTFSIFANRKINSHSLENSEKYLLDGKESGKEHISMSNTATIKYEIGRIKAGEEKEFSFFIYINKNEDEAKIKKIEEIIEKIRQIDILKEQIETEKYWVKFVQNHDTLKLFQDKPTNKIQEMFMNDSTILNIYTRSILMFPLLINNKTGGISAALEVDENITKSSRYSYCWPRDAVFEAEALDILGMHEEITKFYTNFAKITQGEDGMWEQRYYTDGRVAPCWGYQIDETASIVYGVWQHYKVIGSKEFLKNCLPMCKKAVEYLKGYIRNIVNLKSIERKENLSIAEEVEKEKAKEQGILYKGEGYRKPVYLSEESFDLWEDNQGVFLYSLSAIYSAINSMILIIKELYTETYRSKSVSAIFEDKRRVKKGKILDRRYENEIEELHQYMILIRSYMLAKLSNPDLNTLKRSNKDDKADISVLGAVYPFEVFEPSERIVKNTVEKIIMTLRTYTGGIKRYEGDKYLEGKNPWPIATLWLSLYYLKDGKKDKSFEGFRFVINTASKLGYIGEQINNETMKSDWVIGLGWSHAMFIIVLDYLLNNEE